MGVARAYYAFLRTTDASSFPVYAYRLSYYACYDGVRQVLGFRWTKRPQIDSIDDLAPWDLPRVYPGYEDQREEERKIACLRALYRLPDGEREVIYLRFWQDTPHLQVANQLGHNVQWTEKKQRQALNRLRRELSAVAS